MGCNIDKMLIKGIRSFSPDNQNVIEFYRPLTLIVGQNGAGKTTVIECLKMACTGELPPNTRSGQSFIHDPKVAGETEVKAQIKLRFLTATRQPVVVIRSFQLTQKKTSMQFKALDNVLQTINRATGQKEALSYRCADIDRIVPSLMGVSKAILENVIFVHQEDSNWPLAEGQVLKKKFDDIFAATKYTKALEALRKLRTEKSQEVKEMRLKLEHLKSNRDVAQKLRNEVDDGTERVHKLELQIAEIEGDMAAVEACLRQLSDQLSVIADYGDERAQLQAQHDMLEAQNAETFARLLSMYGPDDIDTSVEELEMFEAEMQPKFSDADLELKKLGRDIQSKLMEVEAIKERFTRDVKNQGRLAAEADAHTRNCADRDRFLHTLAAEAGLPAPAGGANGAVNAEAVAEFVSAFDGKVREVGGRLEKTKAQHRAADDDHGRSIDKVSAELSGAAEGVRMKADALRRNEAQLAQLGSALEACVVNAGLLQDAKSRLSDLEARLGAKQTALSQSSYEEESRKCTASLAELAAKASGLRTERDRLASAADQASQMRYKSNEVAQRRQQVEALLAVRRTKLESLLGVKELPPIDQLREAVEVALSRRRREQDLASKRLKEVQQKLSSKAGEQDAVAGQLHRLETELEQLSRELEGKLQEACGGQVGGALAECAHKAEEERKAHQTSLTQMEAFRSMSSHFINTANTNNTCLTCGRPFANPAEKQQFLEQQAQQHKEIPSRAAQAQQQLEAAEQRVQKLKALQPIALRHDRLREEEVPDLQRRLAGLQQEVKALEEEEGEAQEEFLVVDGEAQAGQSLLQEAAWPIDRLAKEIKEREREVENLKNEVSATTATRTVAEVDQELEDLERDRTKLEAAKEEANRKLQRLRDEVSSLRTEFHKAREEVTRLGSTAEKRDALQAQIAELSADSVRMREEIQGADAARKPLEAKKAQLLQERERLRGEARAREAEIEGQLRKLNTLETQLQAKQRAIEEYERGGRAEALEKVNATLEALRAQQEAGERAVKALQDQQREKENHSHTMGEMKRQVEDCLAFAKSKAQLQDLRRQLEGLEASMGQVGDRSSIHREFEVLKAQQTELRSKRDTHLGSVATIKDNVLRAEEDLRNPSYEGIEERYRRQLIELKTTEMANSDLEKYHKALEKALLAFHTSKMADINKVVKELWQKTYRNSDIDYIAIRTDSEGGAARSYNYRVAMYCGGAELDMRGRCSAGQKVLACLIIRLALAETFCLNCGILALDEPTTNLDAANAASLAESLRAIMQSRRDQENFQLVVITHDEQFAHLIGTREYCDFYWRITKDTDQHSHIAQEEIGE